MNYREFTCLYCGAKAIDRSPAQKRLYCSIECRDIYWRRKHGVGVTTKTPSCIHNIHILCGDHKCGTCGWNPKVEKKRKEALGYG